MLYKKELDQVKKILLWLNANGRHAIELSETFAFPAYDVSIRNAIKGTNKVRCYNTCMIALHVEFILALMRMYDTYKGNTACFEALFKYLSNDFIRHHEASSHTTIAESIHTALNHYKALKGSHVLGRLKTVRNKMFTHTSTRFNRSQIAEYEDADKLLNKTLPILNIINYAITGKEEPFGNISRWWRGYSRDFWSVYSNEH